MLLLCGLVLAASHKLDVWCLNPQLVSCNVSSYQHTSVALEFFETVVRYDKFFIVEPQHIPVVLVSFSVCLSPPFRHVFTGLFTDRWHFWTNGDCDTTAQRSAAGWLTSSPDLSKLCSEYDVDCHHSANPNPNPFTGAAAVLLLCSPVNT